MEPLERRVVPDPARGPVLSVVIVTFNAWELAERCLRSVEAQRRDVRLEVIVVDNASRDGTPDHIAQAFPWVQLRREAENVGFAAANNRALREARGEFVLLLNPDTEVPPRGLQAALEAIRSRPGIGVLGCKLLKPDGTLDHACKRGFPTPADAIAYFARLERSAIGRALARGHAGRYVAAELGEDEEGPVGAVNGAFMLVRRATLEDVGELDERFWMYGEDLDWCYRSWQAGWPVYYWPGVHVLHVKGGTSGARRPFRTNREFHRAMWLFYRKHYAARYSRAVTASVRIGVTLMLALSVARNAVAKGRA